MAEKFYRKEDVYEEAKKRIRYLFDEFQEIVVGFSGGKDSTVCLNLTIEIAREKGRLPVKVLFIDQEAEWQTVIDYVRSVMERPEVEPLWFQMPLKIFNATSTIETWLQCWEEGKDWIREKEPNSIKENKYGTDRFAELFTNIVDTDYPDRTLAYISGVRCEESPTRMMALTGDITYKWITWGKYLNKKLGHYTFYPLYDWSYTDIWKAISSNNWDYCRLYDFMYQYGIAPRNMRVSNVHHETAVRSLYFLQEIEGDTWDRITQRISGINTTGMIKDRAFNVTELPYMFKDWREYRDYLLDNFIKDSMVHAKFESTIIKWDEMFTEGSSIDLAACYVAISAILHNDYHMTIMGNFWRSPSVNNYRKYKEGNFEKLPIETVRNRSTFAFLEAEWGTEIYA
jgi:predicted phosphoadenosine phosphosulfate sulfurtransferase